ncbi:cytochrome c [Halobacillus locisalis]|uniref:Cytochrome c n=1 Tax=Halobacillus locisalis TaxID=220753 RepID=A0A838CUI2_9BACI|nr:cytochrome c [Halobacillus locisalis]MBA2175581.1 cytochrome c [Halobacillus locisalis]
MKKWLSAMFLVLILVLGACGGGGGDEEPAENEDSGMEEGMDEENGDTGGDSGDMEGSEEGGDTVDAEAAEAVYQNNCASCHGGDMGGGVGPALQEVGSKYSADEIVDIIKNGKGQMPAQGQVSDEDAQLVASWLATMK